MARAEFVRLAARASELLAAALAHHEECGKKHTPDEERRY